MKELSLTPKQIVVAALIAMAVSLGSCVGTVLMSDLSVLPIGERVTGPRQVLPEDFGEWAEFYAEGGAVAARDGSSGFSGNASAVGRQRYLHSCASCHGQQGHGMPYQGPGLRRSAFVAGQSDEQLIRFLKAGRLPDDARSVMRLFMPPLGGNPALNDEDLTHIVAYMRGMQNQALGEAADTQAALGPGRVPSGG